MDPDVENKLDLLFERCQGDKYNCSMLFFVITTVLYFKDSKEPFLKSLAWFNYFLNKTNTVDCNSIVDINKNMNSGFNDNNMGKLNNKLLKCMSNKEIVKKFILWFLTMVNKKIYKKKEESIIIPSIIIMKKELVNIKNLVRPNNIEMVDWKFMENYWYIRWLATTILPLKYYKQKQIARTTNNDKVISGMYLYNRKVLSDKGLLSGIKGSMGLDNQNIIPKYYIYGKLYPDKKPPSINYGGCDDNSARLMGLAIRSSVWYYQPIKSYELACADSDSKIRTKSHKYIVKKKNKRTRLIVGNIVFIFINGRDRIKILFRNNLKKTILTLEYRAESAPPPTTTTPPPPPPVEVGMIYIFGIDVIQIKKDNTGAIYYKITDNAYVMRDQFNIDILGYNTINMLIHLYPIIELNDFM